MFELYGVPYTYKVDLAGIDLVRTSDQAEFRVGLQYLGFISALESGVHLSHMLDRAEAMYWELIRKPTALRHRNYEQKQLQDVAVHWAADEPAAFYDALENHGVKLIAPEPASYHLAVPKELDGTFLSFQKPTIVIAFGFHGVRISPVICPDVGQTSYLKRRAWAEGFCFQNFTYKSPSPTELNLAANVIKKQICDFSLERTAVHFCSDTLTMMRCILPEDIE